MLINKQNKLSYIKNLMFRTEFLEMMNRDFSLNSENPYHHEIIIISKEPPIISTEIKESYTFYPLDTDSFQIKIRSLMIEQPSLNRIQVISDINFPENFCWPVVEDSKFQKEKEMNCFTGKKSSKWNLALIDKYEKYHFIDTYHLAYRENYKEKVSEIVQTSTYDPYRMIEYMIHSESGFETDLTICDETKWESQSKVQYSIKKDKNGMYRIF